MNRIPPPRGLLALAAIAAAASLLPAAPASAAIAGLSGEFILSGAKAVDFATNTPTDFNTNTVDTTAFPYANTQSLTGSDWSTTGTYTLDPSKVNISFNQSRGGTPGGYTQVSGTVNFKAADTGTFNLTSQLTVDNVGAGTGYSQIRAYLVDNSATSGNGVLLDALVNQSNMPDGTLVLGPTAGDSRQYAGAQTGTLQAGHLYQLQYTVSTYAYPGDDQGANATGFVNIDVTPTPEPAAAATLALAATPTLLRRHRRHRHRL